ncbi:SIR2 family histone deacetylase [Aspergillus luchuensis]|uniref:SIR2 family histone deacetylase n=1 Tax=Aspergillus kawachii TaxID=1069201 RepID=A0A146F6N4_ASPKA|nr:SIR2 family histone deacetylase [Aspergillus luchuensis]
MLRRRMLFPPFRVMDPWFLTSSSSSTYGIDEAERIDRIPSLVNNIYVFYSVRPEAILECSPHRHYYHHSLLLNNWIVIVGAVSIDSTDISSNHPPRTVHLPD